MLELPTKRRPLGRRRLRRQFIQDVPSGATPLAELCLAYQISRKTAYKWLARYDAGWLLALADRSRRPHSPTATPPELVHALLAARARYPSWGPRKPLRLVTADGSRPVAGTQSLESRRIAHGGGAVAYSTGRD